MTKSVLSNLNEVASVLEDAVNEQDWSMVVSAYGLLTGIELDEPETPDNPGDILSELMTRLSRLEGKRTLSKEKVVSTQPVPSKEKKAKAVRSVNKFEEMTDIFGEVDKEPGFKKINDKVKPIKRRKPYRPARATCVKCKNSFEVSPVLAKENYQCDDCIGS